MEYPRSNRYDINLVREKACGRIEWLFNSKIMAITTCFFLSRNLGCL
jgi:hypothetical protein